MNETEREREGGKEGGARERLRERERERDRDFIELEVHLQGRIVNSLLVIH